jgi:multidrug efflux pump subunit AcrB
VATPVWGVDDPVIWRRQRLPFITVQTDLAAGLRAEAVSQQLSPLVSRIRASLPPEYTIEEGGVVDESDKGNSSVFAVLPVTLFVMLILLMVQLQRFSRMLLALFMAPFGLIGIVLAMLPTGTPMGFVALLGIIALAGMIIRNAVILISEVDNNVREGLDRDEAIKAAAQHRSRPILLTACAAILGMIPIAEQVFWGPMAYAIIGGLIVATFVTLTVLPAALSLIMQFENNRVNQKVS